MRTWPTAPLAACSLIAGYGVVAASGSRALGGVVLALGAAACVAVWTRRHGPALAARLAAVGVVAFVASHLLGLAIGAWPGVLVAAGAGAAIVWVQADQRRQGLTAGARG